MKLNFRKLGEGSPLFILHGVFGSSDNWQTIGKELAKQHCVYLIDQRNHGSSEHSDVMNYDVMADDINELMLAEGLSAINLLGHSMGGKVAMNMATRFPKAINQLIIIDITPREYPPHHDLIFDGFYSVDLQNLSSRKEAEQQMSSVIKDFGVSQFILKNLTRSDKGFSWKINLSVIEENVNEIGKALASQQIFGGETLFIGGSKSDYILSSDSELINHHFPKSTTKMIAGAGHWVHAEKPKELLEELESFLNKTT